VHTPELYDPGAFRVFRKALLSAPDAASPAATAAPAATTAPDATAAPASPATRSLVVDVGAGIG
jgi:hypothetical protein